MSEILNLSPDIGCQVDYTYSNITHDLFSGDQHVNALWVQPIARFGFRVSLMTQATYEYVKSFFVNRQGSLSPFLFRDPIDFKATHAIVGNELGTTTQGILYEDNGVFFLAKRYQLEGLGFVVRPITRPNEVEVKDVNDNVLTVSIDFNTGVVSGAGVNADCTWQGTFWTLVRFENDTMPLQTLSFSKSELKQQYQLPDLRLVEVKESSGIVSQNISSEYDHYYQLPWEIANRVDRLSKTDIYTSTSGYEARNSVFNDRVKLTQSESKIYKDEKDYLIALWRLLLGTWGNFKFRDIEAQVDGKFRFENDIRFETVAQTPDESLMVYKVSNMSARQEFTPSKTTQCRTWKIRKRDNTEIGFTEHDQRLSINSLNHVSNLGITGDSTPTTSQLNTDTTSLSSAIVPFNVTEREFLSGQLSDAELEVNAYNWLTNTNIRRIHTGNLAEYELSFFGSTPKQFTIQSNSRANKLDSSDSIKTSYSCRAKFLSQGEGQCNRTIDNTVRNNRSVTASTVSEVTIDSPLVDPEHYKQGTISPVNGDMAGREFIVGNVIGTTIKLLFPSPLPIDINTTIEITKRCDKLVESGCTRHNHVSDFKGYPKSQGSDTSIASAT